MGAIVDILHLDPTEHQIFRDRFPACILSEIGAPPHPTKYRIIIPDEDEESYYLFLVDNCLALCSANFLGRVESDPVFAEKMRLHVRSKMPTGMGL